jgi:hypothetical protein
MKGEGGDIYDLRYLWHKFAIVSVYNKEDCHGLRPGNDKCWNFAQNTKLKKQSQFVP